MELLKAAQIYYLLLLGVRSLKGRLLREAFCEKLCPWLLQLLLALPSIFKEAMARLLSDSASYCFWHHFIFSQCLWFCFAWLSFIRTLVTTSVNPPIWSACLNSFNQVTSAWFLLPCEVTYSQVLGIMIQTSLEG